MGYVKRGNLELSVKNEELVSNLLVLKKLSYNLDCLEEITD